MRPAAAIFLALILSAAGNARSGAAAWRADPLDDPSAFCDRLRDRFVPARAAVVVRYDIAYRFLFIEIASLARADVTAIEGAWPLADGSATPAVFLDIAIRTPDRIEGGRRARTSMDNRVVAAFGMPDLEPLVYVKRTDEHINPLLGRRRIRDEIEVYDLTEGDLAFRRLDYHAQRASTELVGHVDMTRQGREISIVLRRMAEVYHGARPMLDRDPDARVTANIEGVATPFDLVTRREAAPAEIFGRQPWSLRVDVYPAPEAGLRGKPLTLWAMSVQDLAEVTGDARLIAHAAGLPDWHMTPLVADYALTLGRIRARLLSIEVAPPAPDR